MSQSVSGGDATTTGDDLDQNFDGSIDSNDDDDRLPTTDYTKGKKYAFFFINHCHANESFR